ncbi:hypothetical protein H4J02_05015 [Protaetiibacter sp. SSC-01]|uniref:hypothetical protein n=1 Tax=Protaetiibacter sp. SSC-01 TaxID=2759943 RepID=UPI001656DE3F|nr:hypothetical protein [Protaetiibacter sp. SSC-01]QNO38378.1 hypothetical protein H4J02_05015 [Protaetiibacter sp. SSC-01]
MTGWIVAAIVVFAALAVGGFVWSANEQGAAQGALSGIASAFVSVALALLISEILLKPILAEDIRNAAGLSRRVTDLGLRDMLPEGKVDFADFYRDGGAIWMVVVQPSSWLARDIDEVVQSAKSKPSEFEIAFPEPGAVSDAMALVLGKDSEAYRAEVLAAAAELERRWRSESISNGSKLTIHWMGAPPSNFFGVSSQRCLIGIEPAAHRTGLGGVVVSIDRSTGTDIDSWVERVLSSSKAAVADPPVWVS